LSTPAHLPVSRQKAPESYAHRWATFLDKGNSMSKKYDPSESPRTPNDKEDRDNQSVLPGWPGYRTRNGRSGYDPIDTRIEAAHISGAFIQQLFTGQLRIRNPIYLFLFGVLGLVLITPFFLAILERLNGNLLSWNAWIFVLITAGIGLAMLTNFIKNMIRTLNNKGSNWVE
jgi:hypothetical protein